MASYLALPRPADLGKAIIIPLAFGIGSLLTSPPSTHQILRALVVWFAVEYLAYQARYQWNDIRGFWSDQLHPDCDARGRLPGPVERGRAHIMLSSVVAAVRVFAAVLVIVAAQVDAAFIASVAAVFAVAVVYEWVRAHAGPCGPAQRPPAACVALWVVSGGGYCVRGLTGLLLASGTHVGAAGLALAGLACWSTGIVFVTTRWAVESIPFVIRREGRLQWVASPDAGRGHLLALAHWLPQDAAEAPADLPSWRILWLRRPWHAPWNVALLIALGSAWLGGAALAAARVTGLSAVGLSAAVLAAWTILVLRPRLITGAAAVIILVAAAIAGYGTPAPAALGVAVCLVYLMSTHQCLRDVGKVYKRCIQPVVAAAGALHAPTLRAAGAGIDHASVIDQVRRP